VNPGKTMGIVALVLSILPFQLIGVILGFVALSQSKKVGQKNGFAVAAIIIGFVLMALGLVIALGSLALFGSAFAPIFGSLFQVCAELGTGVWEIDGVTYTCP
jgi:sulfite exporter TauE/SafE